MAIWYYSDSKNTILEYGWHNDYKSTDGSAQKLLVTEKEELKSLKVTVQAKKQINGVALSENQLSFRLYASQHNLISQAGNAADYASFQFYLKEKNS